MTIDQVALSCSTAVASALGRIVIYSATADGWPDQKIFESGDLDFSTTGAKTDAVVISLFAGAVYWLGVHHSSTATIRSVALGAARPLVANGSNGSNQMTVVRRTVPFGTAPATWSFVSGDLVANVTPPSVRWRMA